MNFKTSVKIKGKEQKKKKKNQNNEHKAIHSKNYISYHCTQC